MAKVKSDDLNHLVNVKFNFDGFKSPSISIHHALQARQKIGLKVQGIFFSHF